MKQESKLLGYYNYTVILTYIGMLSGFFGITYSMDGDLHAAMMCLLIAGLCDMFDGAVASTRPRTAQEKCFGIQIDSLSDLICFGVLPAVMLYSMAGQENRLAHGIACLYVLCALIRLAYFNVDEQERQQKTSESRSLYYGMPVTMTALFVPTLYGMTCLFQWKLCGLLSMLLAVSAVLFLLPIPIKKPKFLGKLCMLLCGAAEVFLVIFACGDLA